MTYIEQEIDRLFAELVPFIGKANTVAGEIIRAISRIAYRCWNDGDHIGVGYGNHTCNAAARYLKKNTDINISRIIDAMWGVYDDEAYGEMLNKLEYEIVKLIVENPHLKEVKNSEDFLNYYYKPEDNNYDDELEW